MTIVVDTIVMVSAAFWPKSEDVSWSRRATARLEAPRTAPALWPAAFISAGHETRLAGPPAECAGRMGEGRLLVVGSRGIRLRVGQHSCYPPAISAKRKTMKTGASTTTRTCPKVVAAYLRRGHAWRLLSLLVVSALPTAAQVQFGYTTTNGTVIITNYIGADRGVTIPNTINGLPVVAIGYCAFLNSCVTSVTIPDSVTTIGIGAFDYCECLTNVTLPNGITHIADAEFWACTSLTSITIPSGVSSIDDNAFGNCLSLSRVTIPNSVSSIGACAFYACTHLTNVVIPDSVTSIGDGAFCLCQSLPTVTIPNSVTNDGTALFAQCSNLSSFTVPGGATTIGDNEFDHCSSLTNIVIPSGITRIGTNAFGSCTRLVSVTIPGSVASIGAGAFDNCYTLISVALSNGVTWIGNNAFQGCTSLTNIAIPNGVTTIGNGAFYDCYNLSSVTIPSSVSSIGDQAFSACTRLRAITVDALNPVFSSVDGVFFDKPQTTLLVYPGGKAGSYAIPSSATSIAAYGFFWCGSLTGVTLPSGVTNIGDYAFANCPSLTGIYFEGNPPDVGQHVFDFGGSSGYSPGTAVVYYLPSTTGWGPTLGSCRTSLWRPHVQTGDASFGLRTNQFGFTINWAGGMTVVVEANTNLANPAWMPLATNTLTSGSAYFSDPQWTNYPARFYRLRWP